MTKLRLLALLAVVALVLFPAIGFAQGGAPQLPCAFYGTVVVDGQDVADGTTITATIGNETYSDTTTDSAYRIVIPQPEGKVYDGQTVSFKIGNDAVSQTGTWSMGGNVMVDLTKGAAAPTDGGTITQVKVISLAAGATPTVSYDAATGILTLGIPAGATGPAGPAGPTGPAGEDGDDASSVLGIVAIILAAIALIAALVAILRRPKAVRV